MIPIALSRPVRAAGVAMLTLAAGVPTASAVDLVPHRAGYALELESAQPNSGISDVRGAMAFELVEECEGWSVHQEFRMAITNAEGDSVPSETVFNSYESRDGTEFHFESTTTTGGQVTEALKGRASLGENGGTVRMTKPESETLALPPGTVFPTRHIVMLIEAARAGQRIFDRHMFDGGDAEGAYQVVAAIGNPRPAEEESDRPLLHAASWPVSMAFYAPGQVEDTPDFQVDGRLYANGIATGLRIDYGGFVVRGELVELVELDQPDC